MSTTTVDDARRGEAARGPGVAPDLRLVTQSRPVETPTLRVLDTGQTLLLVAEVTTVGRGPGVDLSLDDPSVSPLHAELVRRGRRVYVDDLGLSRTGTRVNGKAVARRLLADGDVLGFGDARVRLTGLAQEGHDTVTPPRRVRDLPDLTPRELDVLTALCAPAQSALAFVSPATVTEIARALVVTEAAVKQHLGKLYLKFRIGEGPERRARLANEVLQSGLVRAGAHVPLTEAGA